MSDLHKEIEFETEICDHLAAHGWHYASDDAQTYDRARALFPADLIAWIQTTQPRAWETLTQTHGSSAETILCDRLRQSIDQRGTLDVLRHGIELLGLRQSLRLAQFKPAIALNPDILKDYAANRLRVVRQVRYSLHNQNAIDLVLFLNGIPVATVELKSDFTQGIDDAVEQYRRDRLPQTKGKSAEPLLSFPNGALVHFAVSNSNVRMTTQLVGAMTRFLPFNRGNPTAAGSSAAGNPPNPLGHPTAYLWETVWERASWLDIVGRYLIPQRDSKKQIKALIFPRYHQLDVTRKLINAVLHDGAGGKYLIQHSAGSGKTNSIAWSAHFLADLHDAQSQKLFDTVLVVSDRTVLDGQLQDAIFAFERTTGVVATIKGESNSKSGELAAALKGGKKIVVCTIQTFPFALKAVQELAATQGKRFAVIADEAHSSQTGEAAAKLKQVLSAEDLQDVADGGDVSAEDLLAAQLAHQMANRTDAAGITYVAFTATPKAKTLELFGRRPNLALPASADNLPAPFHVYSMQQAIEEGFILDVLQNYTSFNLAFKLAHAGEAQAENQAEEPPHAFNDEEVERKEATKQILRWVKLNPHNIAKKVEIIIEHFREAIAPLLNGQAKAMVVVGSRVEAVRWQLAMQTYIQQHGYAIATLVAFSGDVNDPQTGSDPVTETHNSLNPNLKGRDIGDAFATADYQILLVANKFQTGFDQPLLCGMYVDKRLGGIQAVQTLSRLNRAYPGKDTTYILDFVNDPVEILAAFKTYYTTAQLEDITDPNRIFDLRMKLDSTGFYDDADVDRVVAVELNPNAKQSQLIAALEPITKRLLDHYKTAQTQYQTAQANQNDQAAQDAHNELESLLLFKSDMGAFVRLYAFLCQIFDYGNTAIEKRSIFYKRLMPLLEFGRDRDRIDLSQLVLTHYTLKPQGDRTLSLQEGAASCLKPPNELGSGAVQAKQQALLADIIAKVNDLFEGDLTESDRLIYINHVIKGKLLESETLVQQANNNTKEQFANSPDLANEILNAIMDALTAHTAMSTQALDSDSIRTGLRDILLGPAQLYEALRTSR